MRLSSLLPGIAVLMVLATSMIVLAVSLNASVKGVAGGGANVEKVNVRVIGVEDRLIRRASILTATAVDVIISSDRYATHIVKLTVTGTTTTTVSTSIAFYGTTTVSFPINMVGWGGRSFYHRVEVSPA